VCADEPFSFARRARVDVAVEPPYVETVLVLLASARG